ncbi:MAG: polyhydroxyalkanoic acid system family protein [Acidobacteriota bacterium]
MADMMIKQSTRFTSMEECRPALDEALRAQFPGGMMKARWEGDVLCLSGPGAEGTVRFEDGELVGQASLKPPASMMKGTIEQKVKAVLQNAVG